MLCLKMPVDAIVSILEAEVRQMTPEERAELINGIVRVKQLADNLAEAKKNKPTTPKEE